MRPDAPAGAGGSDDSERPADPAAYRMLLPLAYGELSEKDARELGHLKEVILQKLGFDCRSYKEPCLRRRIAVRMRARGTHSYVQYGNLLKSDDSEGARLLDAITINVSKFFRNAETWAVIRERIVPQLFKMNVPKVRIWSAGCASGEEPYTMAMVLIQYADQHNQRNQLRKFDILGTDVDSSVLDLAAKGEYGPFSFGDIGAAEKARFFDDNRLRAEVKRMVRFEVLDLMTGPFPKHQHVIFCRNVIIYFERNVQERLFAEFHKALQPEGFLVLGKVETIFGSAATLYRSLASRERIFCKA